MKLKLNVDKIRQQISNWDVFQTVGKLHSAAGILSARAPSALGNLCEISQGNRVAQAEVVSFQGDLSRMMPFHRLDSISSDARIRILNHRHSVPCGDALLGRVLDGLGNPVDGRGPLRGAHRRELDPVTPAALRRKAIHEPLVTGVRAIDALTTLGVGQRVGLFAGSGVGKSTLLGEIAKGSMAERNVIVLVGERGREVNPFIEQCLQAEGLRKSVVIVSTSDEPPLMRLRSVQTAITIADEFRQRGANVMFLLDSVTRLAMAQREIGLLIGEPPTSRGYTPSVFQLLASCLEQLGNSEHGSITAIVTVLVEGGDMEEPIADCIRSLVDGHIVLTRRLAERGQYPAIDVSRSLSRLFSEISTPQHAEAARRLRAALATYEEVEDLVRAGAYAAGSDPTVDCALRLQPLIRSFLKQKPGESSSFPDSLAQLIRIGDQWKE
jgi:flagellum-specific ATP synthase